MPNVRNPRRNVVIENVVEGSIPVSEDVIYCQQLAAQAAEEGAERRIARDMEQSFHGTTLTGATQATGIPGVTHYGRPPTPGNPYGSYTINYTTEPIHELGHTEPVEIVPANPTVTVYRNIVSTPHAHLVQGYYHATYSTGEVVYHYIPGTGRARDSVTMERLRTIAADPTVLTGSFTIDTWDGYVGPRRDDTIHYPPPEIYMDSRIEPMAEIIKGFRK